MTTRALYLLSLFGLAGLALIGLYRADGLIFVFVVLAAVVAVSGFAWEAREARTR